MAGWLDGRTGNRRRTDELVTTDGAFVFSAGNKSTRGGGREPGPVAFGAFLQALSRRAVR